jgi:diguanylate cyclase (GGDEF)-like protein
LFLDTKTLWVALTASNLLLGVIMLAYAYSGPERGMIRIWSAGQILKGLGIVGIIVRPLLPSAIAYIGPNIVIIGYFLELTAFLYYGGYSARLRPALAVLVGLLIAYNTGVAALGHGAQARHLAALFSSSMAILTGLNAVTMAQAMRSRSKIQLLLVVTNGLLSASSLLRAGIALTTPEWTPEGTMPINQILFAAAYVFSLSDGFAFLLLVKEDSDRTMQRMATVDGLTGLLNRAAFLSQADDLRRLCQRTGQPVTLIMLDVDYFKTINDTHGHAAGDEVLRLLGEALRHHLRDIDICGRLGGEEFAVILPGTGWADAALAAERLRLAIAELSVPFHGQIIRLSISLGIADLGGTAVLEQAMSRADSNLYTAKAQGRNRVVAA